MMLIFTQLYFYTDLLYGTVFSLSGYGDHRDLHVLAHALPLRRSADLAVQASHERNKKFRIEPFKKSIEGVAATRDFVIERIAQAQKASGIRSDLIASEIGRAHV